jgi:hypothetical protein
VADPPSIEVRPSREGRGWVISVTVFDDDTSRAFDVEVTAEELARFDPGAADPTELVHRSFEFLLAREPKESILPSFGLSTIARYFPEYEREIRCRGRPGRPD